jgi:hypothetical protein
MKDALVVLGSNRKSARISAAAAFLAGILITGTLTTACSSVPTSDIKVHSALDAKANMKGYKSFAWVESGGVLLDRTGVWVAKDIDTHAEVVFQVDKALRARGLQVSKEKPDLMVALLFVGDVKDVQEIADKRGAALSKFDAVGEGALLVELIDAETGKSVWLGAAEGEIRQSRSVEDGKKRLSYAVDKMFSQLPR